VRGERQEVKYVKMAWAGGRLARGPEVRYWWRKRGKKKPGEGPGHYDTSKQVPQGAAPVRIKINFFNSQGVVTGGREEMKEWGGDSKKVFLILSANTKRDRRWEREGGDQREIDVS